MLQGVIKAKDKCKPDKVRIQIGGIYSVLRGNDIRSRAGFLFQINSSVIFQTNPHLM